MQAALDAYSASCVTELETSVVSRLTVDGPTAFHALHRLSGQPIAYVERAVQLLVMRGTVRWTTPMARFFADRKLELTRTTPVLRVWAEYNGWRTL